jgi:imidazolonepropionase-like amidohydrolase
MTKADISQAKGPDLRASPAAMQRAAQLARRTAIQTEPGIVIVRNGKIVPISAQELRRDALEENKND